MALPNIALSTIILRPYISAKEPQMVENIVIAIAGMPVKTPAHLGDLAYIRYSQFLNIKGYKRHNEIETSNSDHFCYPGCIEIFSP